VSFTASTALPPSHFAYCGALSSPTICSVTGASSGIGREVALSLADKGFCLILVGRKSDTLRETQKLLRRRSKESGRKGDRFLTVLGDLSMPGGAEAIWDDVSRLGCTIEAAVQCAGCCWRDQFVESPCSKIEEQLMTNVVGTTMLSRLAAEDMAKRGRGRILIISSMTALTPNPSVAAYAASKAYLRSFALALGSELEPRGVAVTCSLPGATTGTGFQERSNLDNALCFRIPGSACSVSTVASKSVDAMMQGDPEVIIGWSNRIWAHVLRPIMPPKVAMLVVQRTFR
jgi:short-subunit dehydrogenase